MLRKEIVDEYFIETPLRDSQGVIKTLPLEGELLREFLKNTWLKVELPQGQTPKVSVGPKILEDGKEGYSIRKEILYLQLKV